METNVDLGFIEKCEPWLLANKFFPSKLGGRPAWLDLEQIPQPTAIKCTECNNELTFLCQVNSVITKMSFANYPIKMKFIPEIDLCPTGRVRTLFPSHNFHFHLYKFKLLASKCGQVWIFRTYSMPISWINSIIDFSNIKALRCQLPRRNRFYDYEPCSEDIKTVCFLNWNTKITFPDIFDSLNFK